MALLDSTRDSWPRGVNCGSLYRDYTISSPPLASSSAWPAISCNSRTPCQVKATVGHSHGGRCIYPILWHRRTGAYARLLAREPAEANVAGEVSGPAGAGSGERRYSRNHGDRSGCSRPWRGKAQGHSPPQGKIGVRSNAYRGCTRRKHGSEITLSPRREHRTEGHTVIGAIEEATRSAAVAAARGAPPVH